MKEYIAQLLASLLLGVAIVFVIVLINEKDEKQKQEYIEIQQAEHEIQEVYEPMPDEYYEDVDWGAHVIHAENSVDVDGELAGWYTLSVAYNRILHPNYPNNLHDVIYQMGQYECTWNGGLYKEEPNDVEYEISAEMKQTGGIIPKNVIYASEFPQGSGVYTKIGCTYYCYE